jgi:patatin-like phospholipase/acyl hydrolase
MRYIGGGSPFGGSMSKYRILSIDGGGVRGVLAARILERLEQAVPGIIDQADLLAGTSTGSIIAVGLAKGLPPANLVSLYQQNSGQIFHQSLLHDLGDLWGFIGAKYSWKNRWQGLFPTFGDTTLGQLGKKVLVAAFDLGGTADVNGIHQWRARFFHNFDGPASAANEKAMDVIMRSSAAPTYFPILFRVRNYAESILKTAQPCLSSSD